MANVKEIRKGLDDVLVPGVGRSLKQMNLVKEVTKKRENVLIRLANAAINEPNQKLIEKVVREAVSNLTDKSDVEIEFVNTRPREINEVGKLVAIMSGKGGVGKSLITALSAVALRREGYQVGILDADLTGPSIPKMFGIQERPQGSTNGILPVVSSTGIEVISINLLLKEEDDAVIWRGPLIAKAINQFWEDVAWGKLDYLLVDLPPGTADAPLTVMQSLPLDGAIIVFTPQDLTTMIVKKAINMATKLKKPVLGVVENMSYLYVPEIDKKIELFGKSRAEEMSADAGAPSLGSIPIDPELASLCDRGQIEKYNSDIFKDFAKNLLGAIGK